MIKKIYVCDCCGKEVTANEMMTKNIVLEGNSYTYDLCKDCATNLVNEVQEIKDQYKKAQEKADTAFDKAKKAKEEALSAALETKNAAIVELKKKYKIDTDSAKTKTQEESTYKKDAVSKLEEQLRQFFNSIF